MLEVNTVTGDVTMTGGEESRDLNAYEIHSAASSLDSANWLTSNFDAQDLNGTRPGVGQSWDVFDATTMRLTEAFLLGAIC